MTVPGRCDVGLRDAGEVALRAGAACGVGDYGPLQIGTAADGTRLKGGVDGAFNPETVVPVGAAVFVGYKESGCSMGDSGVIAGDGGGDAEYLTHGARWSGGRAGIGSGFVEDVGFDSVGEGVGAAMTLDSDGINSPYTVVQVAGIVLRDQECADAWGCGVRSRVVAVVVGVERRRVVYACVRGHDAGDWSDVRVALRGGGLYVRCGVEDGLIEDGAGEYERRLRRGVVILIHAGVGTESVVAGKGSSELRHGGGENALERHVLMCCGLRIGGRLRESKCGAKSKDDCNGELPDWTH